RAAARSKPTRPARKRNARSRSKTSVRRKRVSARLSAAVSLDALTAADPPGMVCSDGWEVTGYYTPVETDFSGTSEEIEVQGHGRERFPRDFLKDVRMEGWGQTRLRWFLGYSGARYQKADAPLNARGQPLRVGSLAVDRHEIPFG